MLTSYMVPDDATKKVISLMKLRMHDIACF